MFLTWVEQVKGIELTLWRGEERLESRCFPPYGPAAGDQNTEPDALRVACEGWLGGLGVSALQVVLVAGLDFRASASGSCRVDKLARTFGACLCAIPLWWEEDLPELAEVSGFPGIKRKGVYDRIAHEAALCRLERESEPNLSARLIVASLGEGVSVAAYAGGRLLDVNNARDGEGPMGWKCSGSLPTEPFIHWAFTGGKTRAELESALEEEGGWAAYKGMMSAEEWEEIMAYQVVKEIGAMRAVLKQRVDRIVLTGEMASRSGMARIRKRLPPDPAVQEIPGADRALGLARIWLTDMRLAAERGGKLD
ncbi:butyrate kinase 2 [Peptococcaceae bacterium CEB3]|nr:butyrate kinase 2 [Peptococcaceae bacterium CEB3]